MLRGLAIQMTNPKAVLAWIAIMSLGMQHDAPLWVVGAIVVGTSALSLAIHYLYAVAFSTPAMVLSASTKSACISIVRVDPWTITV